MSEKWWKFLINFLSAEMGCSWKYNASKLMSKLWQVLNVKTTAAKNIEFAPDIFSFSWETNTKYEEQII
jgi:hypothetical protein